MDRNHGAYVIYHFCFSFNNLFPVKCLRRLARDRRYTQLKTARVAFVSPTCSHLQQRCPGLKQLHGSCVRPVPSTRNCRLDHPGSLFLPAVLRELGQTLHKFTQECRTFYSFFCVLPLTCCVALGKLLNLAETLLFPL